MSVNVPLLSLDKLETTALTALGDVAKDPKNPAASRVSAAVGILNYLKSDSTKTTSVQPGAEMDLGQIDAELAKLAG